VHDLVRASGSKLVWNQGYILVYLQNTKTSYDHTGLGKNLLPNEKTEVFLSKYQVLLLFPSLKGISYHQQTHSCLKVVSDQHNECHMPELIWFSLVIYICTSICTL
jgi:hypothetical protein